MRDPDTAVRKFLIPVLAALAVPGVSGAQEMTDDVVISTGFRPEALSDTIGSAAVIDSSVIGARGAVHLESVLSTTGNVTLSSASSRGRFVQIRGIGDLEQFVDPKHFPSVGVSVDGIDLGGIANAAMLFDVDQIEVLRGPQGTRFGASALAGHVAITTAAPSEMFDAYLDAGVGNYGETRFGVAAGGSLGSGVTGRIAAQLSQGDGFIDNSYLGQDDTNGYEESTIRGKLRFEPRDGASYDLAALWFDSDNGYDAYSFDSSRTTLSDQPGTDALELSALGLAGSWAINSGTTLEAHLNWLDSELDYGYDEDWSNPDLCVVFVCPFGDFSNTDRYRRERDDVSLDLRVLAAPASRTRLERNLVLGLYVQDRSESLQRQYYGPFGSDYSAERAALYGQLALTDRIEVTAGFRYERFDDSYADSFGGVLATDDSFRSGDISLSFAATDRSTLYALISRGNKPGGVNTEANSVYPLLEPRFQAFLDSRLSFSGEELTNLEFGIKSRLGQGRLGFRAAVFEMQRDDAQLESWFIQYVPFLWVGILDNADTTIRGAEIDLDYAVTPNWQLLASVGLLDSEVKSLTTFDLNLDDFVVQRGIDQSKSPSWQIYLGSEWLLGDKWAFALDIDARDSERYAHYHDGMIRRLTRVNASVRRQFGQTDVTLWVRNALDEDYSVHGLYFGNDPRNGYLPERYLQPGEPRYAGATVRYNF